MERISLQNTDKCRENLRISYTDIAKEVGMKPPSVIDRIKKIEADGIIFNYCARANHPKPGYDIGAL